MTNAHSSGPVRPQLLAGAQWLDRTSTRRVLELLNQNGHEARAVGGAVRNALMGMPVGEVDVATTAPPQEVMKMAEAAGVRAVDTGSQHGTVTLVFDHQPIEVTTLRKDVETYGRRARVSFTRDWERDASRRDFTMNALYAGQDGTVYDPLDGYADLMARRVRFIGDPYDRIREDFLRILRFFRFEAEYGLPDASPDAMDAQALAAIEQESVGLQQLSGERVQRELIRLLAAPGAERALAAMMDAGVLVLLLRGAPRLREFSSMQAIQAEAGFKADPIVRLAGLAVRVEEEAERLAHDLRLSNAERDELVALPRAARHFSARMDALKAKELLYRLGPRNYRGGVLLAWSGARARSDDPDWSRLMTLPEEWRPPEFPVSGRDLLALGLEPGPQVGEVLRAVEQHWIDGDFTADRQALLNLGRAEIAARTE